jgi:hypothetical protein
MKFEIKFDEEIYKKQILLLCELAYGKEITFYKNSNYLGFVLLFIGSILIYKRPSFFGVAILIFALGNLVPYYIKFFKRKSLLKRLEKEKKEIIKVYNQNPITKWEFLEKTFNFSDFSGSTILDWEDFRAYKIIDETIFMFTKVDNPYILSKIEVGKENFEKIIELLKDKIKTSS